MLRYCFILVMLVVGSGLCAQDRWVSGQVADKLSRQPIPSATIRAVSNGRTVVGSSNGGFRIMVGDRQDSLAVTATGYVPMILAVPDTGLVRVELNPRQDAMDEVVVTGTLRAVQRSASPVPVEVYSPQFFKKNPTPTLFDALQLVNGVRPQLNCNVCNTGDIHINGMEGPYTMVLIDGMPIVSSLSTVYGLQGIPSSLIEKVEVVKGPASSLYGSEAIGGLINVITRNPRKAPVFAADISTTSWLEHNVDLGLRYSLGKKVNALAGMNYFNYTHRFDKNGDNFTDITLQNRLSVFNKLSWNRQKDRQAALAFRLVGEDRWGGEMQWTRQFRGGDSVYGEQISTNRLELLGNYQLPTTEKLMLSYSYNYHRQRSAYGNALYNADQSVGFAQITWDKPWSGKHNLLAGAAIRYTYYDDNTPATLDEDGKDNRPDKVAIPGIFLQQESVIRDRHNLLLGARLDHDPRHGFIFTPRIALKLAVSGNDQLRLNAGSGFRVVNLFTEDHAALTGAREVVLVGALEPERSYNLNLNYSRKFAWTGGVLHLDAAAWYTYFTNRIVPDYTTDPNKIIYQNLDGNSISRGISIQADASFVNRLKVTLGGNLQDVTINSKDDQGNRVSERQLLTESWSATWTVSYSFGKSGWGLDYTGNVYGPMLLPLLSDLDPRDDRSPVWSLQNIQVNRKFGNGMEWYGGVKNLFDFTPDRGNPFLIARAHDPFDKQVQYDANGAVLATPENPYALTFDPNYVYAPNQGRRLFVGFRYTLGRN